MILLGVSTSLSPLGRVSIYDPTCFCFGIFQGDRDLSDISHIVVDEVHERTVLVCSPTLSICHVKSQ